MSIWNGHTYPNRCDRIPPTVPHVRVDTRGLTWTFLDRTLLRFHTLRHTATHLVQSGVDLPTVQRVAGHKTLSMVAPYSHQSGEHIAVAMDQLEERLRRTYAGAKKALAADAPRR